MWDVEYAPAELGARAELVIGNILVCEVCVGLGENPAPTDDPQRLTW